MTDARPEARGRVLVVDDNRVNRLKLSHSVQQQGHEVETAEDGAHALRMLSASAYDVVLLDIVMPEIDGFEVLRRMKGDPNQRETPVIVVSAIDDMDSIVRCIEMGAEDYLPKPFDPALLRARLSTCLERKRLRDLERAYLRQEMALRQNEKLATLGRLSAGLAHEVNNPAAASLRAVRQLDGAIRDLGATQRRLLMSVPREQLDRVEAVGEHLIARLASSHRPDAITFSSLEADLEDWLESRGASEVIDSAHSLAAAGYSPAELDAIVRGLAPDVVASIMDWLSVTAAVHTLLDEIQTGTARVCDVVGALKTYSYMDRSPVQTIDIHLGLEDTLTVLGSRLPAGVEVERAYDRGIPPITAWASELNQVWTHLLENAVEAIAGRTDGRIIVRTRGDDPLVTVEIEDNGAGIPDDVLPRVFDPFFTTKPTGQGTGLGLTIAHNIVVLKHGGEIRAHSTEARTRLVVRLPLTPPEPIGSPA